MTNDQLRDSIDRQIRNTQQEIVILERQFEKEYRDIQDEAGRKKVALQFEMDKAVIEGKIAQLEQEKGKVGEE